MEGGGGEGMKASTYSTSRLFSLFISPIFLMIVWNSIISFKYGFTKLGYWEAWAIVICAHVIFPSYSSVRILEEDDK